MHSIAHFTLLKMPIYFFHFRRRHPICYYYKNKASTYYSCYINLFTISKLWAEKELRLQSGKEIKSQKSAVIVKDT